MTTSIVIMDSRVTGYQCLLGSLTHQLRSLFFGLSLILCLLAHPLAWSAITATQLTATLPSGVVTNSIFTTTDNRQWIVTSGGWYGNAGTAQITLVNADGAYSVQVNSTGTSAKVSEILSADLSSLTATLPSGVVTNSIFTTTDNRQWIVTSGGWYGNAGTAQIWLYNNNGQFIVSEKSTGTSAKVSEIPTSGVTLSSSVLSFAVYSVGTSSPVQSVTLASSGTSALLISSVTSNQDFVQTNNCGSNLPIGSSCLITSTFTPSSFGSRTGTIVITSNAVGSPHSVSLSGMGVTKPSTPVIGEAASGDSQVTVSFKAPANDGGSAITSYVVTASPGGLTAIGLTSPIIVPGLSNGTTYTFTVKATNSQGDSPTSSLSNSVVPKGNQAITFGSAPSIVVGGAGTVSATSTSGLTVGFTSIIPSVCTSIGGTITGVAIGTCVIAANQAGNTYYNAATQVVQNISVGMGNQAITFGSAPSIVVGGTGTVSATSTSGLTVGFTSFTPNVCTSIGGTITGVAIGTCVIAANQAGNANYNAATQVVQNISVGMGNQAITFGSAPSIVVGGTGTVSATSTSGLTVGFTSFTPNVCTSIGGTITGVAIGTCVIAANQAGNANYAAAPQATQTIAVGEGTQGTTYPLTVSRTGTGSGLVQSTSVVAPSSKFLAAQLSLDDLAKVQVIGPRIVGGTGATEGAWPWQVRLSISIHGSTYLCGGSLLSSQWVVTAAHCIVDDFGATVSPTGVTVRAGSLFNDSGGQLVGVSRIIKHTSYASSSQENDIALLELSSAISLSSTANVVAPLLASQETALAATNTLGTVTGWGTASSGGSTSSNLMQVQLPLLTSSYCASASAHGSSITSNMICAGYLSGGGKDSCQGDSGGPLVVPDRQGGYVLAGVVSWGVGCALPNYPGVYTWVANYTSWLQSNTGLTFGGSGAGAINCGSTCSENYTSGTSVTLTATPSSGNSFAGWGGACAGTATTCTVTMDAAKIVSASFQDTPPVCTLIATPTSIPSGSSSTLTSSCSPAATTYVWTGGTCAVTTAPTCTVTPTGTTTYSVAGVNNGGTGIAASASVTVSSFGIIDHYYQNILNRGADAGGKAFWQSEAVRMSTLGVSPSEAYIAMARAFFTSPEFLARGFNEDQFVQNLYLTFFNRSADQGGLDYWKGLLTSGLPRDMVMYAYMFSPEFSSFMLQNVGYTYQRAEVGVVIDFYRAAFGRLPDDGGLKYWVNQFRTAQCSGNPTGSVYSTAISIAGSFFGSAEYWANPPTSSKYVSDQYNAFMRRSADLQGFNYWAGQLSTGAQSYDQVRRQFIDSPEFAQRVQAVAAQACVGAM